MDFWRWAVALSGKKAEKIPMGFNSKKSFAKMDEDSNMAD
jgi:hypothetical protein